MISLRKIRYILKEQRQGEKSDREIYKTTKVSKSTFYRTVRKFNGIKLYRVKEGMMGRGLPGRRPREIPIEHVRKVVECRLRTMANDRTIAQTLKKEGIEISHCRVYEILRSAGMVHMLKDRRKRRKWVRWERRHSLSLWQTDWTLLNGKHLIVILDDASRLVVGWGLFDSATSENSVKVLKEAIERHGKPKAMLTGRDVQFYYSARDGMEHNGRAYFQKFLEANGIRHVLARVNHPQTCGKIERFFGEVKTRITRWKDFGTVDEVVQWHNEVKPHMSLDWENLETPVQAFQRKMHHRARIIKSCVEV